MTLDDFREITKDWPGDAQIDKWNTNYGWTILKSVKLEKIDGKKIVSLQ